jgi:hypothetical protein
MGLGVCPKCGGFVEKGKYPTWVWLVVIIGFFILPQFIFLALLAKKTPTSCPKCGIIPG